MLCTPKSNDMVLTSNDLAFTLNICPAWRAINNKPVQVKHIHGNGWSCILGDLDMGQMKGWELALHSLDTICEWEVHIMNIFKSCHIELVWRGQKLDECHLKIIEIQDFSAVPYTKQDKSQEIWLIQIQSIDENNYEFESDNSQSKKVDIEESRLRLEFEKERDIALRKAVAEVEAIEIANEKAKLALKNN
ncbi:hypothetical protein RhiirA4_424153 [Rhizophagus irregularis]|uniref:Uncharacterized protein n=1 Tax=Rhizophagus irregularis TaxID=588596 RepID=A0A2I1GWE4_9GLOM|nr:hypothetical protein RhiirA4_424153 [Rhizophagus irregularis]